MNKNSPISLIIILLALGAAVYYLIPSFQYYSKAPEQRQELVAKNPSILTKVINLGLDLQGGMRLVLEIDRSSLTEQQDKDIIDRAYAIIENRINALGVAEPTIQKQGDNRLIVELPGLSNEQAARDVIGRTAQLEFKLLRDPAQLERAIKVIDQVVAGGTSGDTTAAVADTAKEQEEAQELAERLFSGADTDSAKDSAAQSDTDTAAVMGEVSSFKNLLARVGESMIGVETGNRYIVEKILQRTDVQQALERAGLGGNSFLWAHDTSMISGRIFRGLYYVKSSPEMRGDVISDAQYSIDQGGLSGGYSVDIEMDRRGARRFSSITGRNIGKYLAIVLDSTVYSAPVIRDKIPLGRAQITGNFSLEEASNLAIVLRAGALPAPVKIIEERTVGPSLGQDAINKGLLGCFIGLILVAGFMAMYYKTCGMVANFALLLNLVLILAVMASINATLTLPGIGGLILIIGMAVDANVIVFERIREELAVGKTVRSAIDSGYSRAFLTIMDANITTLITAFILLWIGTGPIKGFAVTLIIGIIVSLFTALYVTRVIFNFMTANPKVNKLSI
jgi:protein-export membrane protein SecD